jgi:methyl-accepting chemotaxis protein
MRITLIQRIVLGFSIITLSAIALSLSAGYSQRKMATQLEFNASTLTTLLDQTNELGKALQSANRLTLIYLNTTDLKKREEFAKEIDAAIEQYDQNYKQLTNGLDKNLGLSTSLQQINVAAKASNQQLQQNIEIQDQRITSHDLAYAELSTFNSIWSYFDSKISNVIDQAREERNSAAWILQFVRDDGYATGELLSKIISITSLEQFTESEDKLNTNLEEIRKKLKTVYEKFPEAEETLNSYIAELSSQIENPDKLLLQHRNYLELNEQSNKLIQTQAQQVEKILAELDSVTVKIRNLASSSLETAHSDASFFVSLNYVLLLFTILISILVTYTVIRAIRTPLHEIKLALSKLSEGDFTYDINDTFQSELGDISSSIKVLTVHLRKLIADIKDSDIKVNSLAVTGQRQGHEIFTEIEKQQQQTDSMATAVTEMEQAVDEVARHAAESSGAVDNVVSLANKNMDSNQINLKFVEDLQLSLNDASMVIQELYRQSQQIDEILSVIQSISAQTNLLALNAAIEAARAGEQGRGFAVVADEVRSLATRTQTSANEIGDMIKSLQGNSKNAVEIVDMNLKQAEQSVDKTNESYDSLVTMVEHLKAVDDMSRSIATASEQQSAVAKDVAISIVEISDVAKNIAENAQNASQNSENLLALSEGQSKLIGQFKIN